MRIIAGRYGGRVLKSPSNGKTRPTSDRLRETLFNILRANLKSDTRFLDLCAGTGAVGIEALSREIEFATFVDVSKKACSLIEINLDMLGIPESMTEIINENAEKFVKRADANWDVIFFDPPYASDYVPIIEAISESKILSPSGILIAEHHAKSEMPEETGELRRWRIVKQGESLLSFYERH